MKKNIIEICSKSKQLTLLTFGIFYQLWKHDFKFIFSTLINFESTFVNVGKLEFNFIKLLLNSSFCFGKVGSTLLKLIQSFKKITFESCRQSWKSYFFNFPKVNSKLPKLLLKVNQKLT